MDEMRFRRPRTELIFVGLLAIFVLPLATSRPWYALLWLMPIGAAAYVLRIGVDVDEDGLTVRAVAGSRRLRWDEVAGLSADRYGRLSAVLRKGGAIRLPVLLARHLPLIAEASGGRVPDPTAPPQADPAEPPAEPPDRPDQAEA